MAPWAVIEMGLDVALAGEGAQAVEDEIPEALDVEMRIRGAGHDLVRCAAHRYFGETRQIDQRSLALVLPISMTAMAMGQSMWKRRVSGASTGELSGRLSMMSAIIAHQRCMIGSSGSWSIA